MKGYTFLAIIFVTIYTSWAYTVIKSPPSIHEGILFISHTTKILLININGSFFQNNKLIIDYPNQCYVKSAKEGYGIGTHTPAGKCMEIICHKDFSYEKHT